MTEYSYEYSYARKDTPEGTPAVPWVGNPSLLDEISTAFPAPRKWKVRAEGATTTVAFEVELTPAEKTTLDTCHADWTPGATSYYEPVYEVETYAQGKLTKVEYFQTDNGDGTYSDLARGITYNWQGNTLVSKVEKDYYTDGSQRGRAVTTNYYTNSAGQHIRKVN